MHSYRVRSNTCILHTHCHGWFLPATSRVQTYIHPYLCMIIEEHEFCTYLPTYFLTKTLKIFYFFFSHCYSKKSSNIILIFQFVVMVESAYSFGTSLDINFKHYLPKYHQCGWFLLSKPIYCVRGGHIIIYHTYDVSQYTYMHFECFSLLRRVKLILYHY